MRNVQRRRFFTTLALSCAASLFLTAATPSAAPGLESAHFTVAPARQGDAILAPYLLEALEAERQRLGRTGEGKLAVEVVAGPEELDRRTSLGAKDVAAGVPAICEEGRIVLVSPRAAQGGYPWLDAAAREYERCTGAAAAKARPARYPLRWRGAPPPRRDPDAKAELARDYARLGDVLAARGRVVPARMEYEKAMRRGGGKDPDIVARYAHASLRGGAIGKAEAPLRDAAREHPRHAGVQAALGRLEAERGDWAAAQDAFVAAVRVDPFDAEVHAGLALALEKLGDATGASREKEIARMLR